MNAIVASTVSSCIVVSSTKSVSRVAVRPFCRPSSPACCSVLAISFLIICFWGPVKVPNVASCSFTDVMLLGCRRSEEFEDDEGRSRVCCIWRYGPAGVVDT
ncbi:MAG: hypothetical protein ACK55I_03450 [bacterium]